MASVIQSGLRRNILEAAVSEVPKQSVPHPYSRYEEIGPAVIVDVRESCGDADAVRQRYAGARRDVLELAFAEVSPELIPTQLSGEKKVNQTIAVNVRRRDPSAVVIM